MKKQKTLKKTISFKGVGLHTGNPVVVMVHPAPANSGIVFKRSDMPDSAEVPATVEYVLSDQEHAGRQTTLGNDKTIFQTIEHLMATFHAFGIDNARVEIDSAELPALDGNALPYVEEFRKVGIEEQDATKDILEVTEPVYLEKDGTSMVVFPSNELRISYTLSYKHPSLSDQFVSFCVDEDIFVKELAPARTFCLKEEADALLKMGYGKGASTQNTLVFDNNIPVENTLFFDDEAARHKVVDLIGDIYLLGCSLKGHIVTCRTGHAQNIELVKKLLPLKKKAQQKKGAADMVGLRNCTQMDIDQIMKVLPHRYPFLLIDRVVDLEPGKKIVAIKNVSINEPFFQGHFPGHPIMPGVLIVEALAQAGGIVTMLKEENPEEKVAYFMSIDKAKFRAPVVPGDQLRFEVEVVKSKGPIGVCACKAYVDTKLVCSAEVKFTIVKK